jgi:hypothetical protein
MMQKYFSGWRIVAAITILFFVGCKDPYYPEVKSSTAHYLVVEGFINPEGATNIRLTRTRAISKGDTASYINETGANVSIEDNNGNVYPLYDNGGGNYSAGYYSLNENFLYRLHITTKDNKQYVSTFVPCKNSPAIDEVGWKLNDKDVQLFVSSHDENNQTKFYRWDFMQTWELHSQYYSTLVYDPGSQTVVNRSYPVFVCYRSNTSDQVFIGSSEKLKEDVIHKAPLELIPYHDRRISVLYSALVTQYALDSAGYNYWNAMKGNTEQTGSIFGSQPNQTKGNIHNISDSSETVIGYIGAGSTQQKRIFISNADMPPGWNQIRICTEYRVPLDSLDYFFGANVYIPYAADPPNSPSPTGYFSASGSCVDCRLAGGTLDKPAFWP